MCLKQSLPEGACRTVCAAQLPRREPRQLVGLEEVHLTAFERLPDVFRELQNWQVLTDEAAHADPCFTRQEVAQGRVDSQQLLACIARRPAALSLGGLTRVNAADRVQERGQV